jgi:integrase
MLMKHAVEIGLRSDDPMRDVPAIRVKSDGFHSWTDDEIAQFEAKHLIGSKPRLALALLLHGGQRRSDVVRMGRQHVRDGVLQVRQVKTGAELMIPVHPELSAILEQVQTTNLTFLISESGKPFTAAGFSHWFGPDAMRQDYPIAVPTGSERPQRGVWPRRMHRARDRGHHGPRQPARDRATPRLPISSGSPVRRWRR